jgi:hypothetical protein
MFSVERHSPGSICSAATDRVEDNNVGTGERQGETAWRLLHSAMSAVLKERALPDGSANG